MQKVRYELDPYNRLVMIGTDEKSDLPEFRQVIDGQFSIGENNTLTYRVKSPLSQTDNIPNQIMIRGEWSLSDNHDLRLTVDKEGRDTFGDKITLSGQILDVNENSLLFAVTTTTAENTQSTYVLNLEGTWKADEFNRLSFHVRKEEGSCDILTLNGVWEINKTNQIIYQYEKAALLKKKKELHTLTFKGYWDIKDKARISYVLSKSTGSGFDFQTGIGIFSKDYIKYEFGVELAGKAGPIRRVLTIYGEWKLKKDMGLVFEIEYAEKEVRAITFGADAKITGKDTVSFRLKSDVEHKDIGISLELSHDIFKGDGSLFLRLLQSKSESAIYAGAAWRW
jgi:hypothetical protein